LNSTKPILRYTTLNHYLIIQCLLKVNLFGILSLEITDSIRFWDNEDINFARSISEIISIGLETLKRKEIEI